MTNERHLDTEQVQEAMHEADSKDISCNNGARTMCS